MEQFAKDASQFDDDSARLLHMGETEPLINKSQKPNRRASYSVDYEAGDVQCKFETEELAKLGIKDTMTYNTEPLSTWSAFAISHTSVWYSPKLWKMMLRLFVVAVAVCIITVIVVPDPVTIRVYKFTEVSKFLNVVVGLLLGFFMSSSMNRWHNCANGIMQLLDSIRSLQMQFIALGVPDQQASLCLRYGFASAWLLYGQLLLESKELAQNQEEQAEQRDTMWGRLTSKMAYVDRSGQSRVIEQREADILKKTLDPPLMMWIWAAALIGRLAQDGWIPPMPSPTYGRILNICNGAHEGIRQVKASISIQAPLTYTHMLATLVHLNNLLNAVILGVVSGLAVGTALLAHGLHFHTKHDATQGQNTRDSQTMIVTFMYCFLGPMVYQAMLLISLNLAQPFASDDAALPLDRLLHQLEIDLCNGRDLVDHLEFEKPYFKAPPAKPVEVV